MKTHLPVSWVAGGVLMFLSVELAFAQGKITFSGPPSIQPSDSIGVTDYWEQGLRFTPISPSTQFGRSGGAEVNQGFPRNGGPYIYAMYMESLAVDSLRGRPFGLVSVDLAEFSTLYQTPVRVPFVGYKTDGTTVTNEFVTDGVIDGAGPLNDFETFYFDSRFVDLVRVEIPTYGWSLDNLVFFDVVPEPTSGALLVSGGVLLAGFRSLRPKRKPRSHCKRVARKR